MMEVRSICFANALPSLGNPALQSVSNDKCLKFASRLPCAHASVRAGNLIRRVTPTAVAGPPGPTSPDLALQAGMFLCGPVLNVFTVVMVIRIVLTWYPQTDLKKTPWIFLAVPTEPLLRATREIIKPIGGVDISPIVWVAISTFVHEILMGPQGILVLLSRK
jgi:YggT family protein